MTFRFLPHDKGMERRFLKLADDGHGSRDRICAQRQTTNSICMNAKLTHTLEHRSSNQQRTPGMKRRHAAIEVIVGFLARGKYEIAHAKRVPSDDLCEFAACFRHARSISL